MSAASQEIPGLTVADMVRVFNVRVPVGTSIKFPYNEHRMGTGETAGLAYLAEPTERMPEGNPVVALFNIDVNFSDDLKGAYPIGLISLASGEPIFGNSGYTLVRSDPTAPSYMDLCLGIGKAK